MSGENGSSRKPPRRKRGLSGQGEDKATRDRPTPAPPIPRVDDPPPPDPPAPPPPTPEAIVAGLWQNSGLSVERLVEAGRVLHAQCSADELRMLAVSVPASASGLTGARCQRVVAMLTRLSATT